MQSERGQSLLELLVVITVATIVISALVFAAIASLRNADFAQNQTQSTKLAQEGIERVRVGRDRNESMTSGLSFTIGANDGSDNDSIVSNWNDDDFWEERVVITGQNQYFNISPTGLKYLTAATTPPSTIESLNGDKFRRVVIISDDAGTFTSEKTVTVIVTWVDFSGTHESRLSTILRRL